MNEKPPHQKRRPQLHEDEVAASLGASSAGVLPGEPLSGSEPLTEATEAASTDSGAGSSVLAGADSAAGGPSGWLVTGTATMAVGSMGACPANAAASWPRAAAA